MCTPSENAAEQVTKWRRFDLLLANFQAVGKSQSSYVNGLVVFLCLVWVVELLHQAGGVTIQVLGATIQIQGFWHIVPLVCAVLCLGLIGSINLIHHSWRRLDLHVSEMFPGEGEGFFFTEFDPHRNILDYLACLRLSLKKPVLPDSADSPSANKQRWVFSLLLYPSLVLFSIFTTSYALNRMFVSWASVIYVLVSTLAQSVFALPFLWRKICLFTGVHKNAYDGVEWGMEAYYRMPLPVLERIIRKSAKSDD